MDGVFVAGAGIAGLAVARGLRDRGVPVTLGERSAVSGDGLALNLPGNAVVALAGLGLGEALEKVGRPTRRREYRSGRGRLLFTVDEDRFWGPFARPRCVRRKDLLALLEDGLEGVPRRIATVEAVRPVAGGAEVRIAGGDTETHGFVCGADGVHSAVRASAFGDHSVRPALLTAASWRFMAPNPGIDCWTLWSGPAGVLVLIPVDDREVYGYASATRGGPVAADPGWLRSTFGGYPGPVRRVLDTMGTLYHSPVEEVRTRTWARGRCVLLGDAAHATAPVWAQGTALAAEDALVLSGLLADGDWDTAGIRYQQARRSRVHHVHRVTDRFSQGAWLPGWLRDRLLSAMGPLSYRIAYGPLRSPV